MSCKKNCGRKTCHKCHPEQDDCYDLDVLNCPTPCPNGVIDADCVFFSVANKGQSLENIGILSTTSLRELCKKINKAIGNTGTTSFAGINWYDLNPTEKNLSKLFDVIQFISDNLQFLYEKDEEILSSLIIINSRISLLQQELELLNSPGISSSEIGVNTTDNIKTVLQKIVSYIENLPPTVINNYNVDVDISSQQGNKIIVLPDGIYVPDTAALTILDEICNTPELTTKFKDMVNKAGLRHRFFLSNSGTSSVSVEYISYTGTTQNVAVPAGGGIEVSNVKLIVTNPSSILTITYKGNE